MEKKRNVLIVWRLSTLSTDTKRNQKGRKPKKGYCHECNKLMPLDDTTRFPMTNDNEYYCQDIYECPHCFYPNHISQICPTKWKIVLNNVN